MSLFKCPACGKGKLFKSYLHIADTCSECGFPIGRHEVGDGPAFFAVLIVGALVSIAAAVVEIKYQPPFWVHAMLWLPLVVIGTLLSLRWLKALLVRVQYQLKREDFN